MIVELWQGDTEPTEFKLRDKRGPAPLAGATITFNMRLEVGHTLVTRVCEVTDEDGGIVAIPWGSHDLDAPGVYSGSFKVVGPGGTLTYPGPDDPATFIVHAAVA